MKSLNELKKVLKVGVKIKTIYNYCRPEATNEVREISKVKSNSICLKTFRNGSYVDSYLWWDKASKYDIQDNRFSVYADDNHTELLFIYEVVD